MKWTQSSKWISISTLYSISDWIHIFCSQFFRDGVSFKSNELTQWRRCIYLHCLVYIFLFHKQYGNWMKIMHTGKNKKRKVDVWIRIIIIFRRLFKNLRVSWRWFQKKIDDNNNSKNITRLHFVLYNLYQRRVYNDDGNGTVKKISCKTRL